MEVSFSESDIGKVKVGQSATVSVSSMEGTELAGRVTKVDVLPSEGSSSGVVEYPATITLTQSAKGVRAGMSASAEVVVEQVENALTVTSEAITSGPGGGSVTVLEDGKEVQRSVTTGLKGDETTQVLSGLKAGRDGGAARNHGRGRAAKAHRAASAKAAASPAAAPSELRRRRAAQRLPGGALMDTRRHPVIRVEGMTRTYAMGEMRVHALRGVSLRIERGEYVAIMGPSGSGKSTLMNMLGCLDAPSEGRYLLDGADVRDPQRGRALRPAQPQDRLRLPGLQPRHQDHGAGERRTAARLRRAAARRAAAAGAAGAGAGRAWPTASTTAPPSSPAASSSGSRSRGRSSPTRR